MMTTTQIRDAKKAAQSRGIGSLLTLPAANTKFAKSIGGPIRVVGLSLAQHTLSGVNLCDGASAGCVRLCVGSQGMVRVFNRISAARIAKTRFLIEDPITFRTLLWNEIDSQRRSAARAGERLAVRLNTFSDLPWVVTDREEIDERSDVRFFDYTKIQSRYRQFLRGMWSPNYHMTFSRSERTPDSLIDEFCSLGGTVAVPFRVRRKAALPAVWRGIPVIDGDVSDYRGDDAPGSIVGLRAKGSAYADDSGFVVDVADVEGGEA